MKKKFNKTVLFCILASGIILTFWTIHQQTNSSEVSEIKKSSSYPLIEKSGPDFFLKYHNRIRAPYGQEVPEYPSGYQTREFQRAQGTKSSNHQRSAPLDWIERGPGNVGGRTRGIWVDPADSTAQTVFVGSAGGGIWKTEDAGNSWRNLTPNFPNLSTSTIAGSKNNPGILYAGTGEGFGASRNILGSGIWKSQDNGETWTQMQQFANKESIAVVYRIIVNPDNPNEFYFCGYRNPRGAAKGNPNSFIEKSLSGKTSERVYTSESAIQQLVPHPSDFNTIYGAIHGIGIIKTTNGGKTWKEVYRNTAFGRYELAISPTHPDFLYFSTEERTANGSSSHLFLSRDGGTDWHKVEGKNAQNQFGNWFNGQGWYDNTIAVHPYDPDIVYVGGAGPLLEITIESFDTTSQKHLGSLFPVTDGYFQYKSRFPEASSKGVHVDHHNIILIPRDSISGNFYFLNANDGGFAYSSDAGKTFLQTGDNFKSEFGPGGSVIEFPTSLGFNTSQFYGVDKMNGGDRYVGGTQDNGSWVSPVDPLDGSVWRSAPSGDGFEAVWHYHDPNKIIESSQFNVLYRSDNGGIHWYSASPPGAGGDASPFITRLAGSKQDPNLLFTVSSSGLYRSIDFGTSWESISMPSGWQWSGSSSLVRISLATPNIVWSGASLNDNSKMTVSTNAGITFEEVNTYKSISLGVISNIATHPFRDSTAYFIFSQPDGPKIIRTNNLGKSFTDITGFRGNKEESTNGFPDVATYSVLVMPFNEQIIWAGTEIGLFESQDGGNSWSLADNGAPAASIWDMKIVNDEVIIATHGRGIWTVALPELEGYEPVVPAFLSPQISVDDYAFDGIIRGSYNLRSPADSTVIRIEYENEEEKSAIDLIIEANEDPRAQFFNQVAEDLPDSDQFIPASIMITSYQNGEALSFSRDFFLFTVDEEAISDYFNDFDQNKKDFTSLEFSITNPTGFDNNALHTTHPYPNLDEFVSVFQKPIVITEKSALITFDEIVLVEPGDTEPFPSEEFYDFVTIEGTKDRGITWNTIEGYDSRLYPEWLNAYNSNANAASPDLIYPHDVNLLKHFALGDTVYLRFRLESDPFVTGWGWMIDNLQIGDASVPAMDHNLRNDMNIRLLGNPVKDQLNMQISVTGTSEITVAIYSLSGIQFLKPQAFQIIDSQVLDFDVQNLPSGAYLLTIWNQGKTVTRKWIKE